MVLRISPGSARKEIFFVGVDDDEFWDGNASVRLSQGAVDLWRYGRLCGTVTFGIVTIDSGTQQQGPPIAGSLNPGNGGGRGC